MRIIAYCLDWHINQSSAFEELLVRPLREFVDIKLVAWDGQNNAPLETLRRNKFADPIIFCQRPPHPELLNIPEAKIVWIPMWDNVAANWSSDEWWSSLPPNLRIVAFSNGVAQKAQKAGLSTLRLQFHKNPSKFEAVNWKSEYTLFYWNRTGLYGPQFIKKLCSTFDIRELYFRGILDPKIMDKASFDLPDKIGKTIVHKVSRFETQQAYFDVLKRCNVYLAPRTLEGVGLTFLEAMASGCAVMGYNAPTMNEYITHGVDGVLFYGEVKEKRYPFFQKAKNIFQNWIIGRDESNHYGLSASQNWQQLEQLDLEKLGKAARAKQEAGYSLWEEKISDYADYILNW